MTDTDAVQSYLDRFRQDCRALAEQTAMPEQVITDRLSEDGFWYL